MSVHINIGDNPRPLGEDVVHQYNYNNTSPLIPIVPVNDFNNINNNNNNNNNNDYINNYSKHSHSPYKNYAPSITSPALSDTSFTISFASLNVQGINSPSKFESILQDCYNEHFSIIGFQETKLNKNAANIMFKQFNASLQNTFLYRAYWAFNSSDWAGGVCLILSSFVAKYVQKIHRISSRFIAADLYLPAKKLKIINVYGFQKHDFPTKGKAFNLSVIDYIKKAISDGFHVIIMSDFNANPDTYIHFLEQGRAPENYFSLTAFLISNNFVDSHPVDASDRSYATFYQKPNTPTSRID